MTTFMNEIQKRSKTASAPGLPQPTTKVGPSVKRTITYTDLAEDKSALETFTKGQKLFLVLMAVALIIGFAINFLLTLQLMVAGLSLFYFFDGVFNFYIIYKSLQNDTTLSFNPAQLATLRDEELPIYTILCPLYREAKVLPSFVRAITALDWPKDRLDVLILLEEDDTETITAAKNANLPSYFKPIIVPQSQPKTKPKACNYGLTKAKGDYLVIYDAEDIPDPLQLKKAYLGFQVIDDNIICLQAKLNYFNPTQNILTRLFTAEYSLWFDVVLPGLQSLETNIPLGGTSNHFKTEVLRELQGWDPFNVTEDCDLGTRLFMEGYKTAIIDSTTLEEANSKAGNWLRQRSRWIKGYMQTYLVHMRHPITLFKRQGYHALLFQLIIGGKIAFMFINPLLWLVTISYFVFYHYVGSAIEALYAPLIYYMAVFSLAFGNFICFYFYMVGLAKRDHWGLIKYVFFIPFYWLMASTAAFLALYQLITKPHYWEKTVHGLNTDHVDEPQPQIIPTYKPAINYQEISR
jgi:cellulose synthase/poly-beta-1,6-N-acetylglucosamine synthase-like glycosyltransferase